MKNKRYFVNQGVITKSGCGDMNASGEFDTLKEAYEFFEAIKNDDKGWTSKGMVTTEIVDNVFDESIDYYETPTIK